MPALGFSVAHKAPRSVPPARVENRSSDAGFVAAMIALGLFLLALGAWHAQARALLARLIGF